MKQFIFAVGFQKFTQHSFNYLIPSDISLLMTLLSFVYFLHYSELEYSYDEALKIQFVSSRLKENTFTVSHFGAVKQLRAIPAASTVDFDQVCSYHTCHNHSGAKLTHTHP